MKKLNFKQIALSLAIATTASMAFADQTPDEMKAKIAELEAQNAALTQTIEKIEAGKQVELLNLKRFDDLDYKGWTGKDVAVFEDIHAENVHVEGLMSADDLKKHSTDAQGAYASLKEGDGVLSHPIRLADGDWTAVVGETQSTVPDEATGKDKVVKGSMLTLAKWKDGKIVEEYLYSLGGDATTSWINNYIKENVQPTQATPAN